MRTPDDLSAEFESISNVNKPKVKIDQAWYLQHLLLQRKTDSGVL